MRLPRSSTRSSEPGTGRASRLLGVLGLAVGFVAAQRWLRATGELDDLRASHRHTLADRARSEAALRHSSETFANLVANVPGVIFRCLPDEEWTAYFVSDAIEPLTGYPAAEFLGSCVRSLASIVHPDDVDEARRARRDATAGEPYSVAYRALRIDGGVRYVQERGRAIVDGSGEICWIDGAIFDVTDRRLLEERLAQTQRLEAIGRLTGGIAHDFNNALTAIRGYAELLHAALADDPVRSQDAAEIKHAADSATSLVSQLLSFGRRQVLYPVVLDLNALLRDLESMLRRLIGEDVELITICDPDLGRVRADLAQIEQVIVNLAMNARDAMPDGGRLTIETRNARDRDASFVTLRVTDTGSGIDAATLPRIFEPFFTTKEPGAGTGLGLATVYGTVTQSGGRVLVESEPGAGATFTIHLPRVEELIAADTGQKRSVEARAGSETILLVEDEEVVRRLTARVLRDSGYTVIEARNGAHALAVRREARDSIDLLVTDIVMPKLGGRELARSLRATQPGFRTLYMSGYAEELAPSENGVRAPFLQKPFSPDVLVATVRELLDERQRLAG